MNAFFFFTLITKVHHSNIGSVIWWKLCVIKTPVNHTEGTKNDTLITRQQWVLWLPDKDCSCVLQTKLKHPDYQPMAKESLQLAVHFLLHTYLHTKKKLRYVLTYIRPPWIMNISHKQPCLPILMCDLLQGGHGGVDGHSGGVAVEELWSMSVDGAVPGWTGGTRDDQVRAHLPAV